MTLQGLITQVCYLENHSMKILILLGVLEMLSNTFNVTQWRLNLLFMAIITVFYHCSNTDRRTLVTVLTFYLCALLLLLSQEEH